MAGFQDGICPVEHRPIDPHQAKPAIGDVRLDLLPCSLAMLGSDCSFALFPQQRGVALRVGDLGGPQQRAKTVWVEVMRYLIVVEETTSGFSAYPPDLPGCVATASTRHEIECEMASALGFHLDGLREEGLELPVPHTSSTYVDVPA